MKKIKSTFAFVLLAMIFGLGALFVPSLAPGASAFAATGGDISMFTFTVTGDNECSVRLTDKTVTRAIVPSTVDVGDTVYTVTSVAANGFANSSNLEKVWLRFGYQAQSKQSVHQHF